MVDRIDCSARHSLVYTTYTLKLKLCAPVLFVNLLRTDLLGYIQKSSPHTGQKLLNYLSISNIARSSTLILYMYIFCHFFYTPNFVINGIPSSLLSKIQYYIAAPLGFWCTINYNIYTSPSFAITIVSLDMFKCSGTFCEIEANECHSSPCLNNGRCLDLVNEYRCQCPFGWTGQRCEVGLLAASSFVTLKRLWNLQTWYTLQWAR